MGYSSFIVLVELKLIFLSLKISFCCPWYFISGTQPHQRITNFWWLTCCSFLRNVSISIWIRFSSSVFSLSFCENNKPNIKNSWRLGWKSVLNYCQRCLCDSSISFLYKLGSPELCGIAPELCGSVPFNSVSTNVAEPCVRCCARYLQVPRTKGP